MTQAERIVELRNEKELGPSQFADFVGVAPSTITKIEGGDNNMGVKVAMKIADKTGVRVEWLLNGEEPKFSENQIFRTPIKSSDGIGRPSDDAIPYFDVDVTAGFVGFFDDPNAKPSAFLYVPAFKGCLAVPLSGDSMMDRYLPGDIIFIKEIDYWKDGYVAFGNVYLVETRRGLRVVKYVKRTGIPEVWKLESHNPSYHNQDIDLPITHIFRMFEVRGSMNKAML